MLLLHDVIKRSKNIIVQLMMHTPMIPIYLSKLLLLLILRNIICTCNCIQTNKIVKFISNNT